MQIKEIANRWSTDKVRYGIVRDVTLTDKLDSATVYLPHVSKLDIEANDIVELTNEFGDKEYWCVLNYQKNYVTKKSPFVYDYQLNLMEVTHLLEGIRLPSMSITSDDHQLTLYQYISMVYKYYFKTNYNITLDVSSRLSTIFNEKAPNCSFDEPLLKEYLDFLMSQKGYVSKLNVSYSNNNYYLNLGVKSLNASEEVFPTTYLDELVESQSADDYVSTLVTSGTDLVSPETVVETHMMKSDEAFLTSDSAKVILDRKPYDMKSFKIYTMGGDETAFYRFRLDNCCVYGYLVSETTGAYEWKKVNTNFTYLNIYPNKSAITTTYSLNIDSSNYVNMEVGLMDITDNVLISSVYTNKEMLSEGELVSDKHISEAGVYRNDSIYWEKGSRKIEGFNTYQTKTNLLGISSSDLPAIEYAYANACINNIYSNTIEVDYDTVYKYQILAFNVEGVNYRVLWNGNRTAIFEKFGDVYKYDKAIFEVEYQPYDDMVFKNHIESRHYFEMNNSSTNALTDIKSFYAQSTEKNKQLGNPTLSFYANSDTTSVRYQVGQTYTCEDGTYILNELEYTIKPNLITYKGTLSKDYANRYINTIINREKRYFSLPSESEAITRHEIRVIDYSDTIPSNIFTSKYLFATIWIKYTADDTDEFKVGSVPVSRKQLDDTTYQFTVKMEDNVELGYYIGDEVVTRNTTLHKSTLKKYVDDWGVCTFFGAAIGSYSESVVLNNSKYNLPLASSYIYESLGKTKEMVWKKDSRERIEFTIQINNVSL